MEERREMVVFSEWISVGRRGQVNRLMDRLTNHKWPTGCLEREIAGDND
jgi:hypothetical protein